MKLITRLYFTLIILISTVDSCFAASIDSPTVSEPSMFMASVRVLWGLLIVLGLIFSIYAIARKKFNFLPNNTANNIIKIIETRPLMPKKAVYLLEVRGKEYLVGVSDNTINLISPIPGNTTKQFDSILESAVNENENNS